MNLGHVYVGCDPTQQMAILLVVAFLLSPRIKLLFQVAP